MAPTQTQKILASATELYLKEGLQGVSMRKIAARVGVTAPALYRHFANKEDLMGHVIIEGFTIFRRYLYRSMRGSTPEERLYLSNDAYVDFALEQRKYYEILFMVPKELLQKAKRGPLEETGLNTFRMLQDRVRECMQSGYLSKGEVKSAAQTIWAHNHGLVSLYFTGHIDTSPAQFRELFRNSSLQLIEGMR